MSKHWEQITKEIMEAVLKEEMSKCRRCGKRFEHNELFVTSEGWNNALCISCLQDQGLPDWCLPRIRCQRFVDPEQDG